MKITLIFNHLGVPSHQFQAFLSFNEAKGQGTQELVAFCCLFLEI